MRTLIVLSVILISSLTANTSSRAEDLSGETLRSLLAKGLTLTLGGPGEGYTGVVRLTADGKGIGAALLDSGKMLDISGTWEIEGDTFCRKWKFDGYKRQCETWRQIGANKVEVLVDGKKVGVNTLCRAAE
ncbi:hypothetical protein [Pelagibius sp.]|uniref:hypothetical protein n=1 Tax=Pelagibius sp. TaxID=1931238 RepID=UPI0026160119|nr:hypothetical protein [Pelagibius sp.]